MQDIGIFHTESSVGQPLITSDGRFTVRESLIQHGVDDKQMQFLDHEGRWRLYFDLNSLMEMHPGQLDFLLTTHLKEVNHCVDVVLANSCSTGFNSHGERHVYRALKNELDVFRQLHPDEHVDMLVRNKKHVLNLMILTAHLHDSKMIKGRDANNEPSGAFLTSIFGEEAQNNSDFRIIAKAIDGHSEDVATENPDLLFEEKNLLWIILGDKTDWHRERILPSGIKAHKVSFDTHIRLMAFCPSGMAINLLQDGRVGNIMLPFSRMDRESVLPESFHKDSDELKIEVPQNWHHNKEVDAIGYVQSFYGDIKKTYPARLALIVASLFGLCPRMELITFTIHDRESQDKQGFTVARNGSEGWKTFFAFWHYMNNKGTIRTDLAEGRTPKFPAMYGVNVLPQVHRRFRLNLPVPDDKVKSC